MPSSSSRNSCYFCGKREDRSLILTCSFCRKREDEVRKLIAGPTVYICDECVRRYADVLAQDAK